MGTLFPPFNPFILSILLTQSLLSLAHSQNRIGSGKVDELYQTMCASCHGKELEGGTGLPLIDDEWGYGSSDHDIAKVIREGILEQGMVPYGQVLSEEEIRSLVIYIREQKQLAENEGLLEKVLPKDGIFQTEDYHYKLETVVESEGILWSMDFLPNGDMLVAQRDGVIWKVDKNGNKVKIDGTPKVWRVGQGGMMEVILHPDYKNNGWIYLGYTESHLKAQNGRDKGLTTIVRGKITNNHWSDEQIIYRGEDEFHQTSGHHFGTRIVIHHGYLFFSIGDRGHRSFAQDLGKPNGKVHRVFDDGGVPKDNPFVDIVGALPTVWSYGHRNPQGLDMNPVDGTLWLTEHGPRGGDETNLVEPGKNYGWPEITYGMNYDGSPITNQTEKEGMEQPVWYWTPSIAVCGIDFYEGNEFPIWKNNLFVAGLASEEVHRLVIKNNKVIKDEIILKNQGRVRDVASAPDGTLYISLNTKTPLHGKVVRLIPVEK